MSVAIYSTPSCGYCLKAKDYFRTQGIRYTEYNVAANQKKAEEMIKKTGQMGVPVIDINGKVIIGFNEPEIQKALHR